ncbi:sensor histidine kinase [Paenibacillus hexagrammi]|uniref:histidine kinase n=1 Tax=Paenibacillus hexagrammi TaxID=2908839 RepID=A0ABY3SFG9_9BACL|nr:ATP-binding protein [Paenibacillus sp. YPD9-1]UJF31825.1 ATP-binding protein [Paenibacillus sp. YPD9-1]
MMITLHEELDIIAHYLPILQLRYNLIFSLILHIDEACKKSLIPRMILQPLVENSIFHGIVPGGQDGVIEITALNQQDAVIVSIRDNGIGMEPNRMNILTNLQSSQHFNEVGIGLKHVFECIELYFPPGSECSFHSEIGRGTTVTLKLVKQRGPEHPGGEQYV